MDKKNQLVDLKDRKILLALDFDARASLGEIGKKVGLSQQVVDYRIRRMQERGIIKGFYPMIQFIGLGYVYGRLFFKFHNVTKEKELEIEEALVKDPRTKWVLRASVNYDLICGVWTKTLEEFKDFSTEFSSKFGPYIKQKKESIGINIIHFQNRFLTGQRETAVVEVKELKQDLQLDDLDKTLLRVLVRDGRMPTTLLAREVKESAKTIANRLRSLEKRGIILGYRPFIDTSLLGWVYFKVLFYLTNLTEKELKRFLQYLKDNPNVIYIVKEIGISDIDIEAMFPSIEEFFAFMEKLRFEFPNIIKDYEMLVLKETLKINYLPFQ